MTSNVQKRVLIAPLDWGLGHTVRCLPLIRHLRSLGHIPVFAGTDWQRRYINESIEGIETIDLNGYEVTYSRRGGAFLFSLFYQMPRLVRVIKEEHDWLLQLCAGQKFDGIISDNRYGLFHPDIPSVILTHQLEVQSGMGERADRILRGIHYKFLHRFRECWVIDVPGSPNLGGRLSHPDVLPLNARYFGLLSQLGDGNTAGPGGQHLLVLLSGPEPQRTILSKLLWQQVLHYSGKVIFIEGTSKVTPPAIPSHVSYYKRVTGEKLLPLIQNATIVVCRSGYSTLMDLVALKKKAIIIPTPGQTEQEYLGSFLHQQGVYYCMQQKAFNLFQAMKDASVFPFRPLVLPGSHVVYKDVLEEWMKKLN